MFNSLHTSLYRFRWLLLGFAVLIASLICVSALMPATSTGASIVSPPAESRPSLQLASTDSSNVVTTGLGAAADSVLYGVDASGRTLQRGAQTTAAAVGAAGRATTRGATRGGMAVLHGVGAGTVAVARGLGSSAAYVVHLPGTVLGAAGDTALVGSVIKPADRADLPQIDPRLPAPIADAPAEPTAQPATAAPARTAAAPAPSPDQSPAWPLHGDITTLFGVPHWPYQATHTGIDISDGQAAGITPVRPFRPGTVTEVVHSASGLGNHIVIDHGGGLTSVYGHLASTAVLPGQTVDKTTELGREGSTGASTGTHLHFEIRLSGMAVDPRGYVDGQP